MSGDDWPGHHPDVGASMANERVGLAWQRTSMAWLGAGAGVARYFAEGGLRHPRVLVGCAMVLVGGIIWMTGVHRYRGAARAIRNDHPISGPGDRLRLVWLSTVVVIWLAIVCEVSTR